MTVKIPCQNQWLAPVLAKKNEINNELNVLKQMYIKYDAYTFRSVLNVQCTDLSNILTRDLEASQG